ncbi:MAG: AbrB/MazE/SpoVT family DNA-binding domain-containing protein [Pseudomonadales bacterium]|jgi:antitoxin MazE|nr:AbrB/MazE/SpoVT family DNA-binding domain-containing protein [Pseudomonadales bacterium]
MAEATLDIKAWGNSLGVRLPSAIAQAADLHVDQRVRLTVEQGRVVIEPVKKTYLSLAERIAAYDITKHGGEVMNTSPEGAEKW